MTRVSCPCGAEFEKVDGIWLFDPAYKEFFEDHTADALALLAKNVDRYFWFLARKRWVLSVITQYLTQGDTFLDVGAGGCDIAIGARQQGFSVSLSDIQLESLNFARTLRFDDLVQFDVSRPVFSDHFHGVGAFDVIEHLEDDRKAISSLLKMCMPGGYIFLTVPAFPSLWNNRDEMECHKRRYTKRSLASLFRGLDAEIVESRYIFFSIYPLLMIRAWLSRLFPKSEFTSTDHQEQFSISPWVNWLLDNILRLEQKWSPKRGLPFGGSILLVARKI